MQDINELIKVRQNLDAWLTAFNAKDLVTLLLLYDPDSIYAAASAPFLRGVNQIKNWYEQKFSTIKGTLFYKEEAAFQDGNLALLIGAYYFRPPANSEPSADTHLTGRVSLVYRRNQQGDWKLLFHMDNTPPDITPADFAQLYFSQNTFTQ